MTPRALAIPAALVVVLTIVGARIDGSRPSSADPAPTTIRPSGAPSPLARAPSSPAGAPTSSPGASTTSAGVPTTPATTAGTVGTGRTSCRSVVHIGDSTSVGLMSSAYLHDPAQRIDAQYGRVGVTEFHDEIKGARSVVERYKGQENAVDVAARQRAAGFHGCWVLALGTTDAANIAAGASLGAAGRIARLMGVIGSDPVLWVNVKTLVRDGAWAEPHMAVWDEAVTAAAAKYPNVKVYDWASVVQDAWFQQDHIHYTSEGYARRATMIADALATAYPA